MNDILNDLTVVKRSGQRVSFNGTKVAIAIDKGFDSVYDSYNVKDVNKVYEEVLNTIASEYKERKTINVEDIQNIIEICLKKLKYTDVYLSFSEYRFRRARSREVFEIKSQHKFLKAIEKVGYLARSSNNTKPDEMIDKFAKVISKEFATAYLIEGKVEKALEEGVIYLNDLRNYSIGNTSSAHLNINFTDKKTTDDFINEIIKVIILVKKDQYKEHTLMNFDTEISKRLLNDFKYTFTKELFNNLKVVGLDSFISKKKIEYEVSKINNIDDKSFLDSYLINNVLKNIFDLTYKNVIFKLSKLLKNNFKRMFEILESVITNDYKKIIICLDNDNSFISNLIVNNYLECLQKSNKIITNIYVNDSEKTNMLIFEKSKTCNIHFVFENNKNLTYFSNGEKIYENINGSLVSKGRTLNSSSTINLARIALKSNNIKEFFEELDNVMDLNKNALIQRYEIQASKLKENYNVLFSRGLLLDIDKLEEKQKVRKILRNGSLVMGYTGLVEAAFLLNKKDNNSLTKEDFNLIIKIVKVMKNKCDTLTKDLKLNFVLSEVYDEEVNRKLIKIDKSIFGIKKIINKEKYEPLYKFINNSKLSFEEKLDMFFKHQDLSSSIAHINVKNNIDFKKFLKLVEDIKKSKIKYMVLNYDN